MMLKAQAGNAWAFFIFKQSKLSKTTLVFFP